MKSKTGVRTRQQALGVNCSVFVWHFRTGQDSLSSIIISLMCLAATVKTKVLVTLYRCAWKAKDFINNFWCCHLNIFIYTTTQSVFFTCVEKCKLFESINHQILIFITDDSLFFFVWRLVLVSENLRGHVKQFSERCSNFLSVFITLISGFLCICKNKCVQIFAC